MEEGPELSDEEATGLYLLWRHGGVEPVVAWSQWPRWQFDLLTTGLKEELEVLTQLREEGGSADPLSRVKSRAPDFSAGDALLEGFEG